MIEVAGDGVMVILKLLQSLLHTMVRGRLPDKLHLIGIVLLGGGFVIEQF